MMLLKSRSLCDLSFVAPSLSIAAVLACAAGNTVHAQTTPGQLLQDIRTLQPPVHELPVPSQGSALGFKSPETAKAGQVFFVVKRFVLEGNEHVSIEELQSLLAGLLNSTITYDDLKRGTDAIAALYRELNFLARAVLPPQDITEGVVTIRILESRMGRLAIDNRSARITNSQIQSWMDKQVAPGDVIKLDVLEHALLSLDDLSAISVNGYLQEGEEPGETVLAITVQDQGSVSGLAMLDSFGDKNTGKLRASAQLGVNSVIGFADQLDLYGLHTQGSDYLRLGWSTAVSGTNLDQRVGVYASAMDYRITSATFQSAHITGAAEVVGLEFTNSVIRSRSANLMSSISAAHNRFRSWSNGVPDADRQYTSRVTQFGLTGNKLDDWLGGGVSIASFIASTGEIDRPSASDTNRVGGFFSKLRYGANRTQSLTPDLSLFASMTGQLASHNMDSSEQLYLGGAMNVRAYASGQGAASEGQLYTLELRQQLTQQLQLGLFYDAGFVQTWKFNTSNNNVDNQYILRGAGVSAAWQSTNSVSVKATWAQRVGDLSASVASYLSQNGGLDRTRFWLNASIPF